MKRDLTRDIPDCDNPHSKVLQSVMKCPILSESLSYKDPRGLTSTSEDVKLITSLENKKKHDEEIKVL